MKTVRISLNSIDKVKSFVNDLAKFDVDFDLVSGRYVIDAKSIMGMKRKKPLLSNSLCSGSFLDLEERLQRLLWIIVVPPNPLFYMTSTG